MLDEIRAMGFNRLELGHGLKLSLLEGIDRVRQNDRDLEIASLHSYCPLPVDCIKGVPPQRVLSSESEAERRKALRDMLQTLDFAVRMKARFVVVHLGHVPRLSYTPQLIALAEESPSFTPRRVRIVEKALEARAIKGREFFQQAMRSLETLIPAAQERKLVLAIESRYQLEEIPSESELELLFRTFDTDTIAYWHDTGHVQTCQNLGLTDHAQWLDRLQKRLIGSHVHDVIFPHQDHQLPGAGTIRFDQLKALRKSEILKVFELSSSVPSDEIRERLPAFMASLESPA
jgi:sugar phosphate isomerase/epimerase